MDSREVLIIITGTHKGVLLVCVCDGVCVCVKHVGLTVHMTAALALHKAIEEGVSHMWTVSAVQLHQRAIIVADEDATLELRVKTVKYFKGVTVCVIV
jgi:glucosamine-6-phosphate deaminase